MRFPRFGRQRVKHSCILLEGMGWTDLHLHQFTIGNAEYGMPDSDFPNDAFDKGKFTFAKVASHVKDRFRLDYDFSDGWEHRIVVEAIEQAAPGVKYPRCTSGANACPPEDCGGPYGYADLLEILADPKHERREELQESFDENFDPRYFNLSGTYILDCSSRSNRPELSPFSEGNYSQVYRSHLS